MTLRTALCSMLAGWETDLSTKWRKVLNGTDLNWRSPDLEHEFGRDEIILPGRKGSHLPDAPRESHVLRAFERPDPAKLRAVILGQDPYSNPAWATGRAFEQGNLASWPEDPQQVAPSLRRIVLAIAAARAQDPSYAASDHAWRKVLADARRGLFHLEPPRQLFDRLEQEGVLFLNTSLTVSVSGGANQPKICHRHFPLWAPLINRVLTYIAARPSGFAVLLLLGRHAEGIFYESGAKAAAEASGNWKTRVDTVRHFHPAAITAEGPVFLRPPNPFRAANELLQRMGAKPIRW